MTKPLSTHGNTTRRWWILPMAMISFAAIAYGPALRVPFIGDDYVFLDKTRGATFSDLWSRTNVDFGWYRPWSRELHFWTLQNLFGPREFGFRLSSLLLWLVGLWIYYRFVRRCAGSTIAGIAVLGLCSLSLWGAPLTWISGAQDLWMLGWASLTLLLVGRGQWPLALAAYIGALLSKETAATVPLIVAAHARWISHQSWGRALRAAAPFVVLTVLWLGLHPTLAQRIMSPQTYAIGGEQPVPPYKAAALALLTLASLDKILVAPDFAALRPFARIGSAIVLALAVGLLLDPKHGSRTPRPTLASRGDVARFGGAWCLAGWLPLFQSSIGWHAYYGSLGVLGAWLAIAALLAGRSRRTLMLLMFVLGLARGWAAAARSWDWGSEWYQTRAGNMLSLIRAQLLTTYPTLPHRSRLFFGNIPNNIGLIAGRSPAVRVWYDDSTLSAGFYSYYQPRRANEEAGPDYFFHFDTSSGIREVYADGAPHHLGARSDPAWEADHERLAMTFLASGDLVRAAKLFEAIATLPHRADASMFAAVCWEAYGDSLSASANLAKARERTGLTPVQLDDWAQRLREAMPRR